MDALGGVCKSKISAKNGKTVSALLSINHQCCYRCPYHLLDHSQSNGVSGNRTRDTRVADPASHRCAMRALKVRVRMEIDRARGEISSSCFFRWLDKLKKKEKTNAGFLIDDDISEIETGICLDAVFLIEYLQLTPH